MKMTIFDALKFLRFRLFGGKKVVSKCTFFYFTGDAIGRAEVLLGHPPSLTDDQIEMQLSMQWRREMGQPVICLLAFKEPADVPM